MVRLVTLNGCNRLASPADAVRLRLEIDPQHGLFHASFQLDAASQPVRGEGVLLQATNAVEGLFLGSEEAGTILLEPTQ